MYIQVRIFVFDQGSPVHPFSEFQGKDGQRKKRTQKIFYIILYKSRKFFTSTTSKPEQEQLKNTSYVTVLFCVLSCFDGTLQGQSQSKLTVCEIAPHPLITCLGLQLFPEQHNQHNRHNLVSHLWLQLSAQLSQGYCCQQIVEISVFVPNIIKKCIYHTHKKHCYTKQNLIICFDLV